MSPELNSKIINKNPEIQVDPLKNSIYSCGMTLLHAIICQHSDVDSLNSFTAQGQLRKAIESLGDKYGGMLPTLLSQMLLLEAENRPDFTGLQGFTEEFPEIECNVIRDFSAEFVSPISNAPVPYKHLSDEELETEESDLEL